jgi:hypothetical protein
MEKIVSLLKQILSAIGQGNSPWLTLPQAAAYVHMDPQPFRELVYRGDVESHQRSERRIFIHKDALDKLMRSYPSGARVPEVLRRVS